MTIESLPAESVPVRTVLLIEAIASAIAARRNCLDRPAQLTAAGEWAERHTETLRQLAKDYLPSGAGIDCGTMIDLDRSTKDRIVLTCSYHHMNDGGMYDGWTEHVITVRPSFIGQLSLTISGRNRNDIKEYLYQTFEYALTREVPRG